jgi:hypothetical protein
MQDATIPADADTPAGVDNDANNSNNDNCDTLDDLVEYLSDPVSFCCLFMLGVMMETRMAKNNKCQEQIQ